MNHRYQPKSFFLCLLGLTSLTGLLMSIGSSHLLAFQAEPTSSSNLMASSHRWIGPDGKPLPFKSDVEVLDFLRTAEVLKLEKIPEGVTKPRKVYLEKDGIQALAIFRDVDIHKNRWNDPNAGPRVDFRDNCLYECAAYRLSRILGMNVVPPVVPREIKGKKGTLQIWVEKAMTETNRLERKIIPPDMWRWVMQHQVMEIFDQLVYNDDRNVGNILIDADWNLWLIDHTRCFRTFGEIPNAKKIRNCERGLWEKLRSLNEELAEAELGDYLRSTEIDGLMKRRELLVEHIQGLIDTRGEEAVLFQFRPTKSEVSSSSE